MLSTGFAARSFDHISRSFQSPQHEPKNLRKQFLLRNMYNFTVETFAVDNPSKAAYASVTVRVRCLSEGVVLFVGGRSAFFCRSAAPRSSQPWRRRPQRKP